MTEELNEADLKAAEPAMIVKLAAAALGITGVIVALTGVQLLGVRFVVEWYDYFKFVLIGGGALSLALATQVYRARPWAAFAAAGLSGVMMLVVGAWAVVSIPIGIFSCLAIVSTPLAIVSAILAFLAVGPVLKTAAARNRLAQAGMPLGF